jgi:hypothetical protein
LLVDDPEAEPDPTNYYGSGSEKPKNLRIFRIWIRNTGFAGKMKMRLGERSPAGAGQENQENRTQPEVKQNPVPFIGSYFQTRILGLN